jgi:hypothetical protein
MNGTKLLLDTGIVVSLFEGDANLGSLLQNAEVYLSFASEIELLGSQYVNPENQNWVDMFLGECHIAGIDSGVKELASYLQWHYNLNLQEALVAATAMSLGIPLLSLNAHFEKVSEMIFVHYQPSSGSFLPAGYYDI